MTPPRMPISDWASPAVLLTIAAMMLTAWNAYAATKSDQDARIAKLEYRMDAADMWRDQMNRVKEQRDDFVEQTRLRLDRLERK